MASKTPVWLDCDTGHDDAFAILLAAHHPCSRLLGVSTVNGNSTLEHTFYNSRAVLHAIGAADVPIFPGANRPRIREIVNAVDIHGESGLDGVTLLPKLEPTPIATLLEQGPDVVHRMAESILAEPPGTVSLVSTGPLTNVCNLIRHYPNIVDHLAQLSIMGGAVGGGFTDAPLGFVEGEGERFGNWTPWAEFNIYVDPEAAHEVFSNEALANKMTMAALDLTHSVRGIREVQHRLFDAHIDPSSGSLSETRALFREIMNFFSTTYDAVFGIADGPPLHDPLAVLAAICPHYFSPDDSVRWKVAVVVNDGVYSKSDDPSNHVGQTVISPSKNGVRIPRSVDLNAFWSDIDAALSVAESKARSA